MTRPTSAGAIAVAVLILALPGHALADGLPVPVEYTGAGVATPDGSGRYLSVGAGTETRVLLVDQDGGKLLREGGIDGRFTIPAVALDGSGGGLSADGSRLALIRPRPGFPRERTQLAFLNPRNLRLDQIRGRIVLDGDFSFDAISPDGDTVYLIEYTSRRDPTRYRVRALDVATRKLDPVPILDASAATEEMRGFPLTRATSPDGRWEYTLYDGGGDGEPFIHALDVAEGRSVCIDVPQLADGRQLPRVDLGMRPDGGVLSVTGKGGVPIATVNTGTFAVSDPPAPQASDGAGGDGLALGAIAVGIALTLGTALGLRRRRRRAVLPADPVGQEALGAEEEARERAPTVGSVR